MNTVAVVKSEYDAQHQLQVSDISEGCDELCQWNNISSLPSWSVDVFVTTQNIPLGSTSISVGSTKYPNSLVEFPKSINLANFWKASELMVTLTDSTTGWLSKKSRKNLKNIRHYSFLIGSRV